MKDDNLNDTQTKTHYCVKCDSVIQTPICPSCDYDMQFAGDDAKLNNIGKERITYEYNEGLPIPSFHCECGHITEGFSLCLKCNPQSYTVTELKCNAEPDNCYAVEIWNDALELAAKMVETDSPVHLAEQIRKMKK